MQVCCHFASVYLISTVATPSNFFLMASASSLVALSFSALGAPSTRSLASFRPSEVTSRTALMVLILFAPASFRMTVNSVFSSAGARAAAASHSHRGRRRGRNAEPLFELLDQSRRFQQAQAYNLFFQLRQIRHCFLQSEPLNLMYRPQTQVGSFRCAQTRALPSCLTAKTF